jgi:hypothetical protein
MVRVAYQKVPGCFDRDGELPTSSEGLVCCHCNHPYDGEPVPVVSDFCTRTNTYYVEELACTKACTKGYILRNSGDNMTWRRTLLMRQHDMLVVRRRHTAGAPIQMPHSLKALKVMGIDAWRIPDGSPPVVAVEAVQPRMVPHAVMLRIPVTDEEAADADRANLVDAVLPMMMAEDAPAEAAASAAHKSIAAVEMLGNMSTHNLARPPDDECIATVEQLKAAYPDMDLVSIDPGPFEAWREREEANGTLLTDEECAKVRANRKTARQRKRKRFKAAHTRDEDI